jgi:Kef-type K+ transport system membrane component KefB
VKAEDRKTAPRNEPIIITRNFRTLLRNIPIKNPATPLPANETRGVGMFSIIFFLVPGCYSHPLQYAYPKALVVGSHSYTYMSSTKLLWKILSEESDKSWQALEH